MLVRSVCSPWVSPGIVMAILTGAIAQSASAHVAALSVVGSRNGYHGLTTSQTPYTLSQIASWTDNGQGSGRWYEYSSARVDPGRLSVAAAAFSDVDFGPGYPPDLRPNASASGTYTDQIVIENAAHTAEAGVAHVRFRVGVAGFRSDPAYARNALISFTMGQFNQTVTYVSTNTVDVHADVNFIYGQPLGLNFSGNVDVFAGFAADGFDAMGNPRLVSGKISTGMSVAWGGITSITPASGGNDVLYTATGADGFDYRTSFDATPIVVRPGDANTDGAVNFDDLLALARHYNQVAGATWADGDFDANEAVDFADLLTLAKNFNAQSSAAGSFDSQWALAQSIVPEPTALALFTLCLARSRRRSR